MSDNGHHIADDSADAAALAGAAKSSHVGFDEIDTKKKGIVLIKDGYAGLDWSNFYAVDPAKNLHGEHVQGSGLFLGTTSGHQCALNAYGDPSEIYIAKGTFDLDSVELTAAWDTKLQVHLYALGPGGKVAYDMKINITDAKPELFKLDFKDIVSIGFSPLHEKADPQWKKMGHDGPVIAFDDFVFSNFGGKGADPAFGHETAIPHPVFHLDGHAPPPAIA